MSSPQPQNTGSPQTGFTLIEMLVTLSIVVITTLVAVPGFQNFTANQEIKNASQTLYTTLLLARTEALKRNTDVYVYPNGGNAGDWTNGWLVTTDPATTSIDCADTTAEAGLVRAYCGAAQTNVQFAAGAPTQIRYSPGGRAQASRITVCHDNARARTVSVELGGMPMIRQAGACP